MSNLGRLLLSRNLSQPKTASAAEMRLQLQTYSIIQDMHVDVPYPSEQQLFNKHFVRTLYILIISLYLFLCMLQAGTFKSCCCIAQT